MRAQLLDRTEQQIVRLAEWYAAGKLSREKVSEYIGVAGYRWKVGKHFDYDFGATTGEPRWWRNPARTDAAADGLYIIRTNVDADDYNDANVVLSYKRLAEIERAFRCWKDSLAVRPIRVRTEDHVHAHVLLTMLAYYLELDMRRALAPLLFADEAPPERPNPVAPAERPAAARRKIGRRQSDDGMVLRSFRKALE